MCVRISPQLINRFHMSQVFLCSERVQLRAPELSDLDFMYHIENDTRLWSVSACKVPYSRYLLQQYIETNTHDLYVDKQLRLMIVDRLEDKVVGAVDLFDFNPSDRKCEVGVVVDHSARNRGYAREALSLVRDYASGMLGLHQLYAYVFVDNDVANRLFASCAFNSVADLSDWVFYHNCYHDVRLYQCLLP